MKYKKKPVIIEAVKLNRCERFDGGYDGVLFDEYPEWLKEAFDSRVISIDYDKQKQYDYVLLKIKTLEGDHTPMPHDFIIRGELYPCNPDIFEMTHVEVKE